MKISELIENLEKIRGENGDIPVRVFDPDAFRDGDLKEVDAYISLSVNESDETKVDCVTVCCRETWEAFQ